MPTMSKKKWAAVGAAILTAIAAALQQCPDDTKPAGPAVGADAGAP